MDSIDYMYKKRLIALMHIPGESEKTWGVWRTVTPHLAIRLS